MEDQNDTEVEEFVYSDCRIQRADGELDAPALYDDMRVMDMVECIGLGHQLLVTPSLLKDLLSRIE